MDTLKGMASRRTDIFGTADVETEIGLKVTDRQSSSLAQPPQRLDDSGTSIAARMAQANAAEQLRKQQASRDQA